MTGITHIRYPIAALACWIAFAYTLVPLLRGHRRNAGLTALCVSFGCQGMYLAMSTPARWTGTLFGTITWYNVSVQLWIIAVLASQQILLIHWMYPQDEARVRARRRLSLLAVVPVTMAVLFFLATLQGPPRNVFTHLGDQPFFVAYQAAYLTAFVVGKVLVARACWHFAKLTDHAWVRRGLRIAAAGAAVELVYPAGRYADVFLTQYGWNPLQWSDVSRTTLTIGMVLNIVGWTAPLWGPRVSAARGWLADYRSYRLLRPLWLALHQAHPEISLPSSTGSDLSALYDLRFHLHRRVIEIRDGCLALRGHHGVPGAGLAPGQGAAEQRHAEAEAAHIAAALAAGPRAPGQGQVPATVPDGDAADSLTTGGPAADGLAVDGATTGGLMMDGPGDATQDPAGTGGAPASVAVGGPDFSADVAWLVKVSRAFARLRPATARTGQ
ncbi:MAB_1171c family putative transporter [Streptomyces sp. Ac-502]|uniref:MAB_1171c family putative transporter n=1 Tax=Streptomyces sp. Ac-502 TaxID=3342801 RepID=UPI0038629999